MLFWVAAAAIAIAVAVTVALALLRARDSGLERADYDIALYRDQLAGVDADLARGVISEDAAERTRAEISRRILDADRRRRSEAGRRAPAWADSLGVAVVAALLVGGGLGLYAWLGAPGYGDVPRAERLAAAEAMRAGRPSQAEAEATAGPLRPAMPEPDPRQETLVTQLRQTMASRPDDPRGLALLARHEAGLGNFTAAHEAQARLIEVLGADATAQHYLDHADMLILAAGGYVSPEAEAALEAALARDPDNGGARYYTGLLEAQTGRPDRAYEIWRRLLAQSRPGAPWLAPIRSQIERVAAQAGVDYRPPETAPATGPDAADMAAMAEMDPAAQQAMIRGMVDGLAERLAAQGGSPAEWARLISSLGVLGESERAQEAWDAARDSFAGDEAALARLRDAAARAGLAE